MKFSREICLVLILAWLVMPAFAETIPESNCPLPPAEQKMAASTPAIDPPLPNIPVPEQRKRSTAQISTRSPLPNTGEAASLATAEPQHAGDSPGQQPPVMLTCNTGEEQWYVFKGHQLTPPDVRGASRILFAQSYDDESTFRSSVSACTGATVDYFDARADTPTVELLATYDFVFTWINAPCLDNVLFGNNLAAYVDAGGTVILGQFCLPTAGNFLAGAIMDAAYCPVTGTTHESGDYNGDGYDCVHNGITAYGSMFIDVVSTVAGTSYDGTFDNASNSLAVVWRADRRVWYSPGNMGGLSGTGEWAELICNMVNCREYADILFAPANDDDPAFREAITLSCGLTVEYFDATLATPSVERLAAYDIVMTWANFPYADNVAFGDHLAAYVNAGGTVVLGQWCLPTDLNSLAGAIMGPEYCPVTGTTYEVGDFNYLGDSDECVHAEISSLTTNYIDVATPVAGALWAGTFDNPSSTPSTVWREDRKVYYTPGNTGFSLSSGQWNDLICNIYNCQSFGDILYAPSEIDDPAFREAIAVSCGRTVDYFDVRLSTPSLERLANYEAVITWANFAYDDNVLFGDRLAEYVDNLNGTVILGQWCLPTSGNYLSGAIMDPAYCPATGSTNEYGLFTYNNDGSDCVQNGITTLSTSWIDVVTPVAGAQWDGTFDNPSNSLAVAYRPDRRVYYTPGNTGLLFGNGQWADLVCNILDCREYGDILYAPANPDDSAFRNDINASCGLTVDFFNAHLATPSLDQLSKYSCVMTWANYPYENNILFGNNLAAYVDGGGRVILGQWCLPTAGNHLAGSIMLPAYCPVTGNSYELGTFNYNVDGVDCVTSGINSLTTDYMDIVAPVAGALWDGTFDNSSASPVAAWRADRRVYYSPGNLGNLFSSGQWSDLVCNMFNCEDSFGTIDCGLSAQPSSGVLPFVTQFSISLANTYDGQLRRMAARVHLQLAGGAFYANWRVGSTNIAPLDTFTANFNINIPNFAPVVGNNNFQMFAEDVTPAPYNQPPYPMSGDTCTSEQVVTGILP